MDQAVEGLGAEAREKIGALRGADRFFWLDLSVAEAKDGGLSDLLDIPPDALSTLLDFSPRVSPSQKFRIDSDRIVFSFDCFLERGGGGDGDELHAVEVHLMVHGEYVLTVHEERISLLQQLPIRLPEGRSEQYVVYAVLDAMVATAFDSLGQTEGALEDLEVASADVRNARLRMTTLRAISRRLATMRRRIGAQRGLFERIAEEITRVEGLDSDNERYFERIYGQLNRLVEAIDAGASAMAQLVDLRLNETMYWLTAVATIFLPLTFITGFFGMNFKWMIEAVDTPIAFFALGLGGPALLAAATWYFVQRRGNPIEPDDDKVQRFLRASTR